ncbi:HAMP domain-containing sensor histidine kinase [Sphingobium sp. AP49]|uniref:sensor histidine kinase n=1 Tax=Sphingobium sp. AP49 TaxID=1144307 RepID=UPI00026EE51E|nr:HAMP domain-containing sensor histidine kinase [Sphingobium sp. AP49]WHO37998.1 HAMP domain-containing sensor histidine kinase [Sphingobium sp. AP49]
MKARHSIALRLFIGLSAVGLVGGSLLLLFIIREHEQSFRALNDPVAASRAFRELFEHVLVPILVLILPMGIANLIVIRRGLEPLGRAVEQLKVVGRHERGVMIDHATFPTEVLPFAEAVNDLLAQLDRAVRDHEAFAADVAHELRTPLAVIALELDALDHPDAPRLRAELLAMRRLIDQLMLLARVDAQNFAHSIRDTLRLEEVGADIVSLLAPAAIGANKSLSLTCIGEAPVITGQREMVAAALRNLVENALRVTPVDGAVTVLVGPGPRMRVKDGGAGLTSVRLQELAQRHRRADHASREGAGLGLAIVARIMAAHGGQLHSVPEAREVILDFSPKPRMAIPI